MTVGRGVVRKARSAPMRLLTEGHFAPRIESREKSYDEKKRETFHMTVLLFVT